MTILPDLIAKLEAAEGPSRELDAEIALAAGLVAAFFASHDVPFPSDYVDGPGCYVDPATWGGNGHVYEAPKFTASVDAALTLMQEHHCWRYDSALGWAEIFDLGRSPIFVAGSGDDPLGKSHPPATALCNACLKARMEG